jgi:hypothetical protein
VEQRDDDGRHDRRLSENARNLNQLKAYHVYGTHNSHHTICRRVADEDMFRDSTDGCSTERAARVALDDPRRRR